jgi:hypothetical protein
MHRNRAGYAFNEWTPVRKAKFVDLRLQGMHTHWAVFWTLINRRRTINRVYSAAAVQEYWMTDTPPASLWRLPIGVVGYNEGCMPPRELFDQLEEKDAS